MRGERLTIKSSVEAVEAIISDRLPDTAEDLTVIAPTVPLLRTLVQTTERTSSLPSTRILTASTVAELATHDFVTELYLSDPNDSTVAVYCTDDDRLKTPQLPPLLVAEDTTQVVLPSPSGAPKWTVAESDDTTTDAITSHFTPILEQSQRFTSNLPEPAQFYQTAADHLSDGFRNDLERIVETADQIGGDDDPVDIGLVCVALAARHHGGNYSLGQFAEAVNLHSTTSMNRRKRRLEEAGIIDHEGRQYDLGRPRHHLRFTDEALGDVPIEQFLERFREQAKNL